MSQENVELVRRFVEAANCDDVDAGVTCFDRDAVWEHNLGLGTPMEGTYRGHAQIRRLWRAIVEAWGTYRFEIDEIKDDGGQVLALGRVVVRGESSDVPVESPIGCVVDVRAGCIVRNRFFMDKSRALEAAGLSE
jgi:ketosteroid isomerase-like protein